MAERLAAPFLVDWDNDGYNDLLIGEHDGSVRYFKRDSGGKYHFQPGKDSPFHVIHPLPAVNGSYSAATVVAVDFDGDGSLELILSVGGRIRFFRQRHSGRLVEQYGIFNPFRRIRCDWMACRFHAADWDADGDIDLAVPVGRGVAFYENRGGHLMPRLGTENPFNVVLTKFTSNARGWPGYYSSVCMADWDLDGDLDLLVGQTDGSMLYFERLESGMLERRFSDQNPFEDVVQDKHFYPAVHAGRLEVAGDLRLLIGDMSGMINVYNFDQDRTLRFRQYNANPFSDLGYFMSPVPASPLKTETGEMFLMFQEANVGRVSLFKRTLQGRLVNVTPLAGTLSKAVLSAKWLEAGKPQDADFNGDGELDRLTIFHDGRILYQERVEGVLVSQLGPKSLFAEVDLRNNGIEDDAVAGFLPIDWNGDGMLDLIVGAWGLSKLKYFEGGWCSMGSGGCAGRGICDNAVGTCKCLTGYMHEDCSGCVPGYYTHDKLLAPEVVAYECLPCQGMGEDDEGRVCHSRGICMDDHLAWSEISQERELNRLQRGSYRGTGACNCSEFFAGPDCALGKCPPGYEYVWDHDVDHYSCHECTPGTFKADSNNLASCQTCKDGTYSEFPGSARCKACSGWMFAYQTSKDSRLCNPTIWTNLLAISMIACWGLAVWSLVFICGLPGVVADIRVEGSQVHVLCSGHHLVLRSSRPVRLRFWGTGVPDLDTDSVMRGGFRQWLRACCNRKKIEHFFPYKVHRVASTELSLFDGDGHPTTKHIDASTGYFQVLPRHAVMSFGFVHIPLLVWMTAPLLTYCALMAVFSSRFRRISVACVLHALLGALVAACAHWLRWRAVVLTRLASDIQAFSAVLLRKHHPKPCPRGPARAVTARQLRDFNAYFQAYTGLRTTYYVAHNILKPITQPYQLSYAEVAGPSTVRWFVSHFWGTPFAHLISTVTKHAGESAAEDPTWVALALSQSYWICTFSNNQSSAETIQEELGGGNWSTSSFYMAMHCPSTVGTAMVFDDEAMPLTRSWCLFELLQTTILKKARGQRYRGLKLCSPLGIMNNGSGSMDLALNVSRKLANLRLQDAQASVQSDKEMIENLVLAEGGFDEVNMTLIESVKEVLHAVQHSFTRTMQDLETDLAQRGASRARSLSNFVHAGRANTALQLWPDGSTQVRSAALQSIPRMPVHHGVMRPCEILPLLTENLRVS